MKNKIIVSLILILFLAISASAVSANEDIDETITATSDSSDIELSAEEANTLTISDETTEDLSEEVEISNKRSEDKKLGDFDGVGAQLWDVSTIKHLKQYISENKGNTILLKNRTFNFTEPIDINGNCIIQGGIIKAENLDYFFNIESPANGGPSKVTIKDTKFIITKAQKVVIAKGKNEGINDVLNIAGITLENITLEIAEGISPDSVSLLYINTMPKTNTFSNEIDLIDNNLNGANGINIFNTAVNETHYNATKIIYPQETSIYSMNAVHYAIDKAVGDEAFLYQVILMDKKGYGIPGQTLNFAIDELGELSAITDDRGIATLRLSLSTIRSYTVISNFIGNDNLGYKGYMAANTIQILKKEVNLAVKNLSYKVTAAKKLTATFKVPVFDSYGNLKSYKLLANKKVTFTVNGKTYTATTNSKGVAAVKINLNKKGTYYYLAQYAGDSIYNKVVKKARLTIIPLATSLTTKKFTYKKAARTKILYTVLKSGKTALRNQKVVFRVNGKNYIAKTNAKGLAKVKIALNKKGTFTYAVKYAGNNVYKSIAKTNKIAII